MVTRNNRTHFKILRPNKNLNRLINKPPYSVAKIIYRTEKLLINYMKKTVGNEDANLY